ncbi:hypothetical protein CEUSTIGMA_g5991.t1 [Chlamydomonas eustigma]|uniref:Alkyl transferase n=1 Tax=Chlamydomonas eustigma TaxID=1157962 RepID=A0A250X650_9CHLO|nr:hypothetical protein CEUSTIGMA_g5991.t1 [Chlamydomonas eustigma]|eukprot:GAX78551.1 hypothetical protein CEUSTIGMA_g5991.t1 [Chlamydomonas eustigma]
MARGSIPAELTGSPMPRHVAVVMDGNARWAAERGSSTLTGHARGLEAFKNCVSTCSDWGIPALTVFAFSTENWGRSTAEVSFLMSLFTRALREEGQALHSRGVRFRAIGDLSKLPRSLLDEIDRLEALTCDNHQGMQLSVAISFGGRQDLVQAARALAIKAAKGLLSPSEIDETLFEQHLSLAPVLQLVGHPDVLIRTSGEHRLSNFLLWELAYTELVFSPVLWPDFDEVHLMAALLQYQNRNRRFGQRES